MDRTIKVAKETDDCLVFLVELVNVIRQGGDYASLVDELVNAINGAQNIGDEINDLCVFLNTLGARSGDFYKAFSAQKA